MKGIDNTRQIHRYIALDIHKEYVLAGGQTAEQEWVLPPRRIIMTKFREWASANLCEGDAVVLETTTNVWDIYDIVAPLVTRTAVTHAGAVRQIAEARVKTDTEDIKRLIRLLIADIVPEVWVPPLEVRELRGMISYRNRLVKMGTMVRNRLQSLLHRHACDPDFRYIVQQWARLSIHSSAWASAYYQQVRVHCHSESHAYRCLANRWLAVAWKLWQSHTPYDDDFHLRQRLERCQPKSCSAYPQR